MLVIVKLKHAVPILDNIKGRPRFGILKEFTLENTAVSKKYGTCGRGKKCSKP